MRTYIIAFAISLLASVILTRFIRDLALRFSLVDAPAGGRKIHRRPIPRLGGIAIIIAFALPLIGLAVWDNRLSTQLFAEHDLLWALVAGGGVIFATGIYDDIRGMRSLIKLVAQIAAGLLVFAAGVRIEAISVPFLSPVQLDLFVSLPLTLFWIVLVTNAVNLIDGMDGLAGGVAVLAGGTLMIMSGIEGNTLAALLLCCLVGATLGFLVYNVNPASIFMGDTGSLMLGFLLALVSIHSSQKSYTLFSILAAFMVLGIPIFDLSMAVVRRYLVGRPIFSADQHHVHHILLRKGLTQSQSVILLFAAAVVLEMLAFVFIYADDRLSALVILALVPMIGMAVRFLGYDRLIARGRRARMMESVQVQARRRADAIQAFRDALASRPAISELEAALSEVAHHLELERLELTLKFPLQPGEGRTRYVWSRAGGAEEDVHIQGLNKRTFPLALGEVVFGELELQMMDERCMFRPHDVALQNSLADIMTLAFARWSAAHASPTSVTANPNAPNVSWH
ncbi:MAG: MraY family glycosyltransferase [Myxococcota bacterium]